MENIYATLKGIMSEDNLEVMGRTIEAAKEEDEDYRGLMEDTILLTKINLEVAIKPEVQDLQRKIYGYYPTEALQATLAAIPAAEISIPAVEVMMGEEVADLTAKSLSNQKAMIISVLTARGAEIPPEVDIDSIEPIDPFAEINAIEDDWDSNADEN